MGGEVLNLSALNSSLLDMRSFAYDTGASEGISTNVNDFVVVDESAEMKDSVRIQGPSVGTPECLGRGPLVYLINDGSSKLGLIHPKGVLASSSESSPQFRLASAMQLKKRGVRYLGGRFNEKDYIECVRSNLMIPAADTNGILTIMTDGFAKDICYSDEFRFLVQQIENGLCSPLVDITPFLKGIYKSSEEGNEKYARMHVRPTSYFSLPKSRR